MSEVSLNSDIHKLMKDPAGRRVIWEILSCCRMYNNDFGSTNDLLLSAGRRSVGLDILQMLEDADASLYPNLLLEYATKGANNG